MMTKKMVNNFEAILISENYNPPLPSQQSKFFRFLKKTAKITASVLGGMALLYGSFEASRHLLFKQFGLPKYEDNGLAILISHGTNGYPVLEDSTITDIKAEISKPPYSLLINSDTASRLLSKLGQITDDDLKPFAELLLPAYINRVESALGQRANIVIEGATKEDYLRVLNDPQIQSIVTFGHGEWSGFSVTPKKRFISDINDPNFGKYKEVDEKITAEDLLKVNPNPKTGYFLNHSCGKDFGPAFLIRVNDKEQLEQRLRETVASYGAAIITEDDSNFSYASEYGEFYYDVRFKIEFPNTFRNRDYLPLEELVREKLKLEGSANTFHVPMSLRMIAGMGEYGVPNETVELHTGPLAEDKIYTEKSRLLLAEINSIAAEYIAAPEDWVLGSNIFRPENIYHGVGRVNPLIWLINPLGGYRGKAQEPQVAVKIIDKYVLGHHK